MKRQSPWGSVLLQSVQIIKQIDFAEGSKQAALAFFAVKLCKIYTLLVFFIKQHTNRNKPFIERLKVMIRILNKTQNQIN